jgi:putative transposase
VKHFGWNHKRTCGIYRQLELNLRIKPRKIRSDNGPAHISQAIKDCANESGIHLQYTQPSKPQQNAYVERFNRTVRYEWLSQYLWNDIQEVQDFANRWQWQYSNESPNMALGGITPKQRLAMVV